MKGPAKLAQQAAFEVLDDDDADEANDPQMALGEAELEATPGHDDEAVVSVAEPRLKNKFPALHEVACGNVIITYDKSYVDPRGISDYLRPESCSDVQRVCKTSVAQSDSGGWARGGGGSGVTEQWPLKMSRPGKGETLADRVRHGF